MVLTPTSPSGAPVETPFPGNSATTTYQLTGLTSGTAYLVTIKATNAVGTGPASAPATFTCIILFAVGRQGAEPSCRCQHLECSQLPARIGQS